MQNKSRSLSEVLDLIKEKTIDLNFQLDIPEEYKVKLEVVACVLENGNLHMRDLPDVAKNNRDIVKLMMVSNNGDNFQNAPDWVKDDEEIAKYILNASKNYFVLHTVLDCMSPRLKKDKELIIAAIELDSRLMSLVDPELQADPDVIKACMKDQEYFYGDAYKYFPDSVRKDRSVALKMSAGRDFPLELCPPEFKKDREIVINAVKSSAANLEYVAPELLNDDAFIIQMYKLNNDILAKLSHEQKSRLFSFIIQSPVHFGHKWIIHMNMDMDRMSFVNPRMAAKKVEIEKDGRVIFSKDDVTLIEYDADGPVGSYLSIRSINNYVLCGAFVFWVEENSERETWSNTLSKDRHWQGYGPDVQKNDDFLKHKVELVDLESGRQEQIYFGRHKRLPDGIKVFGSVGDFEWAITLLSQEGSPESDRFIKVEPDCLEVINQQPAEIGGAARIFINEWRWLIPNSKGPMAALEVLRKTGDLEDWNWLKTNMGALSDTDMILLQEHFAEAPFAEEVRQLCK